MVVFFAGQLLILLVGVTFHLINRYRCKKHMRPIGYGSQATCNDMITNDDLFYRHPRHQMPVVQRISRRQ